MNCSLINNNSIPTAFVEETVGQYKASCALTEDDILQAAKFILARRFVKGEVINCVNKIKYFFVTQLAQLECEVFCVAFLTSKNHIIACEQMFRGSINSATVYPREVVKRALQLNAAAVILAHNHPSGVPDVSVNDKNLTKRLGTALALVDVKVLDHVIIGGDEATSFAELGLL